MASPLYRKCQAEGIEFKYVFIDGSCNIFGTHDGGTNAAVVLAQRLANKFSTQINIYNFWNDEIFGVIDPKVLTACQES